MANVRISPSKPWTRRTRNPVKGRGRVARTTPPPREREPLRGRFLLHWVDLNWDGGRIGKHTEKKKGISAVLLTLCFGVQNFATRQARECRTARIIAILPQKVRRGSSQGEEKREQKTDQVSQPTTSPKLESIVKALYWGREEVQ